MPWIVIARKPNDENGAVQQAFGPFKSQSEAFEFVSDYDEDVVFSVLMLYPPAEA